MGGKSQCCSKNADSQWLLWLCFAWQSLLELTSWVSSLSTQLSPGLKLTMVVSLRRDRQISCCSLFQGILRCALNNQQDHLAICEQSEGQLPEKIALWTLYICTLPSGGNTHCEIRQGRRRKIIDKCCVCTSEWYNVEPKVIHWSTIVAARLWNRRSYQDLETPFIAAKWNCDIGKYYEVGDKTS